MPPTLLTSLKNFRSKILPFTVSTICIFMSQRKRYTGIHGQLKPVHRLIQDLRPDLLICKLNEARIKKKWKSYSVQKQFPSVCLWELSVASTTRDHIDIYYTQGNGRWNSVVNGNAGFSNHFLLNAEGSLSFSCLYITI